jgi:hypothetical protein
MKYEEINVYSDGSVSANGHGRGEDGVLGLILEAEALPEVLSIYVQAVDGEFTEDDLRARVDLRELIRLAQRETLNEDADDQAPAASFAEHAELGLIEP